MADPDERHPHGLFLRGMLAIQPRKKMPKVRSFSARMFALPVRTGALVNRLILLEWRQILSCLSGRSLFVRCGSRNADPLFLLLAVTGLVLFQAIVWSLASFPKTRASLLTALFFSGSGLPGFAFPS